MRGLIVLLLAACLLMLHHGLPMDASAAMDGDHGSSSQSIGMMLLCAGVVVATVAVLRGLARRVLVRRDGGKLAAPNALRASWVASRRGRPPPRPPTFALLCVNRR